MKFEDKTIKKQFINVFDKKIQRRLIERLQKLKDLNQNYIASDETLVISLIFFEEEERKNCNI